MLLFHNNTPCPYSIAPMFILRHTSSHVRMAAPCKRCCALAIMMITITMARLWSVLAAADYGVERAALRQGGLYEHLGHAASVWAGYDVGVLHGSLEFQRRSVRRSCFGRGKTHTFLIDSQSVKISNDLHTVNSPNEQKDREWTHSQNRSGQNCERVDFFDLRKPPGGPRPKTERATNKHNIGIDPFRGPNFFPEIRPRGPR